MRTSNQGGVLTTTRIEGERQLLISGANGLIGSALIPMLARSGYRIIRLTRRATGPGAISWDPASGRLELRRAGPIEGVIHLAGENIGVRWTAARKTRILESRIRGTRLLSEALARLEPRPRVFISASAVGIYGDRGDELLTESSDPGDSETDFLVRVCLAWESGADPAREAGIRVVHPRFGVVLSPRGGALKKLLPPFTLGLGGPQGTGKQWMSWVAMDDTVGALKHLLDNSQLAGPVNVTSPEPVRNRDFARELGTVLRRPALVPVPESALKLAFGEMAERTILASARVHPSLLLRDGYHFKYPKLAEALRHVLGRDLTGSFRG